MGSILIGISNADERYRNISQVENGLDCNCRCISCGDDLIARQGAKMKHHFAHSTKNKESMACLESAFHSLVTSMVAEKGSCLLAVHRFERHGIDSRRDGGGFGKYALTALGGPVKALHIDHDYSVDRVRPDVSVTVDTGAKLEKIFIEVFSNRAFLRKRQRKIVKNDLTVMEICFDDFDIESYTLDDIRAHLDNVENYGWFTLSQEFMAWAESGWREPWFEVPWTQEKRAAFLKSIADYCHQYGFTLPRYPGYGKQYGYIDLSGSYIKTQFLGADSPEPSRLFHKVEFANLTTLELKIGPQDNIKTIFVSLDYYGMSLDPNKKVFLRSVSPDYPSGADFVKGLSWGRQEKLARQVMAAEQQVRLELKGLLLDEISDVRKLIAGFSGEGQGVYQSRFDKNCGVYVNIGQCMHVVGKEQLEFQDSIISLMQARNEVSVELMMRDFIPAITGQEGSATIISARLEAVKRAYLANNLKIGMVDEALDELGRMNVVMSAKEYVTKYLEWGLENGLFVKAGGGIRVSYSADSISTVIHTHGVWTMAIDPGNPRYRFP